MIQWYTALNQMTCNHRRCQFLYQGALSALYKYCRFSCFHLTVFLSKLWDWDWKWILQRRVFRLEEIHKPNVGNRTGNQTLVLEKPDQLVYESLLEMEVLTKVIHNMHGTKYALYPPTYKAEFYPVKYLPMYNSVFHQYEYDKIFWSYWKMKKKLPNELNSFYGEIRKFYYGIVLTYDGNITRIQSLTQDTIVEHKLYKSDKLIFQLIAANRPLCSPKTDVPLSI